MWIGAGRLVIEFFNNTKASAKTKNIEEFCKDLRKKFNISVLEVAEFDHLERCVIGFAVVMPETWREKAATDFVQKVLEFIDQNAFR